MRQHPCERGSTATPKRSEAAFRPVARALALVLTFALALIAAAPCLAHDGEHEHKADAPKTAEAPKPAQANVGVDEKLGDFLPADIVLRDENGQISRPLCARYLPELSFMQDRQRRDYWKKRQPPAREK